MARQVLDISKVTSYESRKANFASPIFSLIAFVINSLTLFIWLQKGKNYICKCQSGYSVYSLI